MKKRAHFTQCLDTQYEFVLRFTIDFDDYFLLHAKKIKITGNPETDTHKNLTGKYSNIINNIN